MDDVTEKKYYKICKQNIQWKTQKKKACFLNLPVGIKHIEFYFAF
jgi:hypothetical protein